MKTSRGWLAESILPNVMSRNDWNIIIFDITESDESI
jgi:hypothetical protein